MKKMAAWLLVLVMALSLTACGSKEQTKELVGTWHCHIDVSEELNGAMAESLETDGLTVDSEVPMCIDLTVAEDGSYTMALDYTATGDAMKDYFKALTPQLVEIMYAQAEVEGMTREQYDTAMEQMGMSAEEYITAIFDAFDVGSLMESMLGTDGGTIDSGFCRAVDGQLYLADTAEELEAAGYIAYTLEGDTLTWTDEDGALASQLTEEEQAVIAFPMVWTR